MDIGDVAFVHKYDRKCFYREYNIQKCKDMMRKVKIIKPVQQIMR